MPETPPITAPRRRIARRLAGPGSLLAAAGIATILGACDDPFRIEAREANRLDSLIVFAISGTSPALPSAVSTTGFGVLRPTGEFNFDVAFDVDASGYVVLLPVRLVVPSRLVNGVLVAAPRVGLQKINGTFESLDRAPGGGYRYDSTLVLRPGESAAIEVLNQTYCAFDFSTLVYSKIAIDSVDTANRAIFFRLLNDPNCGFRGLGTGVPRN
jgi:hypothetical protein